MKNFKSTLPSSLADIPLPVLSARLDIKRYFDLVKEPLHTVDQRILQQADAFDPGVRGYVEYSLETNGKRIRPALCLLAAQATGGLKDAHYDLAVIVELIHLASLIHDDVMDNALMRRARPTCNFKWGTELSVLLGDCLFSHALKLCTKLPDNEVSRAIADAAHEVCTGEILQTQRRFDLKFTISEYIRTIEMKTAALFRVSCDQAAVLNGAPESWMRALRVYGQDLGTAYQIYDDCIDLFGSEEGTGKTLGTDLAKGKLTLPVLHMLQQLGDGERELVAEWILKGEEGDRNRLSALVVQQGGHLYAARKAQELLERSRRSLSVLPEGIHRETLEAVPKALHSHIATLK